MIDPLAAMARFLTGNLEWLRHRPEADEALADIEACARIVAGIARGPAEQKYLGPCGADVHVPYPPAGPNSGITEIVTCDGDIYARDGAEHGVCRSCGATVPVADRRAWLDGLVRTYAYTAGEIAHAYPEINAGTIRQWAHRGRLAATGADEQGRPRYTLGAVLDLAAAEVARREEQRARRARKTTAA